MHDCDSIALPQGFEAFSSYYLLESLQHSYAALRSCYCLQPIHLSSCQKLSGVWVTQSSMALEKSLSKVGDERSLRIY